MNVTFSSHNLKLLLVPLIGLFFCWSSTRCQTPDSGNSTADSSRILHERRGAGGIEVAYAMRNDGFEGLFFRFFYEAEIGRIFLNAGAFTYNKINDGFGFDFHLRMPWLFYSEASQRNSSPIAGISFTVWPVDKPTVSIAFPIGLEYEFLLEDFPDISVSIIMAPQINLSAEKNTVIFDLRLGIRFD